MTERARLPHAKARTRSTADPAARGFTLIELMVVMVILGLTLMWVPANIQGFGDRTRLDSAASKLVAVLTAARELAVIDGHDVIVEFDLGDPHDRTATGRFRYHLSSVTHESPEGLSQGTVPTDRAPPPQDEWVQTQWQGFPDGVVLSGYSDTSGQWAHSTSSHTIEVRYLPDGTVKPPCALRLSSVDLPREVPHVLTILVNSLTSAASVSEGEVELPIQRDPSDFRY